jgi:hypothetical protein
MERITAPINRHDRGAAVHNLQDALIHLFTPGVAHPRLDRQELAADITDDQQSGVYGAAMHHLQDALLHLFTPDAANPRLDLEALVADLTDEQRNGVYGAATRTAVARLQRENRAAFNLLIETGEHVDASTAAAMNWMLEQVGVFAATRPDFFTVAGRVEFEDGTPGAGFHVYAFDRDLGGRRTPLNDPRYPVITGNDGVFAPIRYGGGRFSDSEGLSGLNADLVFEVSTNGQESSRPIGMIFRRFKTAAGTTETPVADTVLGFEASLVEDVRIVLDGRPSEQGASEYTRLMHALEPMLLDGGSPADLDQERYRDLDFAARETAWDRALIATVATSWQLARDCAKEAGALAETMYGLLRGGAPTEVAPLSATKPELLDQDARWRTKLEDSLKHRIIDGDLEAHLARLRALLVDASTLGGDSRRGGIGDVLAVAGIAHQDRTALLDAYHAHSGPLEDFWSKLTSQLEWGPAKVEAAQAAIQLADVLAYDMPLIERVREKGLATPRDLVTLDLRDWTDLVTDVGPPPDTPGADDYEKIGRTVAAITAVVDATYPTETLARMASVSGDPQLGAARDLLSRFFEDATAATNGDRFDVRTSPVTAYLETHGDTVFRGLEDDQKAMLTSQLQRLQRVFRLGGSRAQTETLLDLGLDSAFHVTRFSTEHFAAQFGAALGGVERAAEVYGRAEQISGTVLYMYTDLWQGLHGTHPMALRSAYREERIPVLKELPTYKALFGGVQLCDCGECQSVYSPAAYFVDLLHMLDRPAGKFVNPAEILFARRPDLAHIQLTCDNTNTRIPYVDLVTEVLESFVANRAPTPFNIPPPAPNRRLSSPSGDELRVNPVYVTAASSTFADQAYAVLQEAAFPLALPLNLPLETTRTYLENLGVTRAELMPLFDRDEGLEAVMARAAEILLMSPEEFEVIAGSKFGGAASLRPPTTAELFGLVAGPGATTAFNHAAPEFSRTTTPPDPRRTQIRSLQNVLGFAVGTPVPITGLYDVATEAAVNAVLTASALPANGRTDDAFWGAMERAAMPSLSVMVCPVPMFLDRTGVTYEELVAIVKTRFVNPTLQGEGDQDYLARLGMSAVLVSAWIRAGFPTMPGSIAAVLKAAGEDPDEFTTWVKRRARAVVINTSFEAPCDLDRTTLMHLDGTLLTPQELERFFGFIRVWRRLGWTLAEVDLALEPGALASNAVFGTMLMLANVKQLRAQLNASVADIVSLWQTIPRHGDPAVYDTLFRNRAAQLLDPILALNRERTEVAAAESATPPVLSDHVGSLLAGFRVSAQELGLLRTAAGLDDDPALPPAVRPRLDLASLSAIHRRVSLAHALGITIRDLLGLLDLSGLAVFERPDRVPRGHALVFADVVPKVRTSGVKVSALVYLCRAELPSPPPTSAQQSVWSGTLAALVDGLHAIESEQPIEDDPEGEEFVARLTVLVGADDARAITDLVYGRDVYTAPLAGFPPTFVFPAALSGRVSYDAVRKQLRLRGAMTVPDRAALLAAAGVPSVVKVAYERAVKSIAAQPRTFATRALAAMFSTADAEALLINVPSLDGTGVPIRAAIDAKVEEVMARRRIALSRSSIKQTLTTTTGLGADLVSLVLENEAVLKSVDGSGPAMNDYQALEGDGVDAEYFANTDFTGVATLQRVDATVGFDLQGAAPGPGVPAVGFSVRWTGHLYVPAAGEVAFRIRCTDGVVLTINDIVVIDESRDQSESEFNATVRLDGGEFYPIEVRYYSKTTDALLEVSWSSPAIPDATVPQASLYTRHRFESLVGRVERIYKLALLLTPFNLTADDLLALAVQGDISLDAMPLAGPVAVAARQAMFAQWIALYDFAALRDRYAASDVSVLDLTSAPTRADAVARFARLSGVAVETIDAVLDALTARVFDPVTSTWKSEPTDLTQLSWWVRIADAVATTERTGAAPSQLLAWAKAREIDEQPTGPETRWIAWTSLDEAKNSQREVNARRAQEAKNLVRARYDEDRWRAEARQLNDRLRIRRRSALTSYVLAMPEMMRANVADTGRLFEFLLIDVEMDPCMETSRIKQGISSVQLFIQRVLLNLETDVTPDRIDAARWTWMKTYRVWEANRKVFLYAESFVEGDLRDDKTPIFKELESELLQDELTDPNAERAFRHYLEKLDGIGKLIVCGTCVDVEASTLHVFARTATVPFVFYHRRLENRGGFSWSEGVWTPWEKLPVDVATIDDGEDSGAHLIPMVWNRRLYLFWPIFEQKPDDDQNIGLPAGFDRIDCWHVKLAWSEYKDDRWTPKQVSVPFVVSPSLVRPFRRDLTLPKEFFQPDHVTVTLVVKAEILGFEVAKFSNTTRLTKANVITYNEDPLLSGTVLEKDGDWASHEHHEKGATILSLQPKPRDHYFDATVHNEELTIRVFCRHSGTPSGQFRTEKEDLLVVVKDGRRSDRKETSQVDGHANGNHEGISRLVGAFHFPACGAHVDANSNGQTLDFNTLARPLDTHNAFMAFAPEAKRAPGLRLPKTNTPMLGAVPARFDVIDLDGQIGFVSRAFGGFQTGGPFFFQDQQRCYFVTYDPYFSMFDGPLVFNVRPDARAMIAERAVGLATVTDRKIGITPESSLRANPWARNALSSWAAGPGLSVAFQSKTEPAIQLLSDSIDKGVVVSESVRDVFGTVSARALPEYTFIPHWHPYTCSFIAALNAGGLSKFFTLDTQVLTDAKIIFIIGGPSFFANNFAFIYKPDPARVAQPFPVENVDFGRTGAYSQYNWETFFHAPLAVAMAHSRAGRFNDALRWFHFVFDPMTTAAADVSNERVWRFLPFRTADTTRIEDTLDLLTYTGADAAKLKARAELQASIQEWLDNPFNPHLIARRRPVVYMKHVFMKYLDNLIAWADQLFQRDTIESINEATGLYVLAANLLGPRPQRTPAPGPVAPETFQSLRARLDALSNAQVDLETRLPFTQLFRPSNGVAAQLMNLPQTLYFCLPQNAKLLAYWDTVADRLFKIRHCMSLDGTVRQLPLFEPPIDPALLVEAIAHGLDIGSVLNDLYAPLPRYRFSFMLQQALAMCSEVRSLGSMLLGVLEKRDAEQLATLRAKHETLLLDQIKANKKLQIDEAEQTRQALENTVRMTSARVDYYDGLIAQGLISQEDDQLRELGTGDERQATASWIEATAQLLSLVPNVTVGGTSSGSTFGGSNLGSAASAVGKSIASEAASHAYKANRASIIGMHSRRLEDWRFERDHAKRELAQVEKQSAATRIRKAISEGELRNHEMQIEHARGVEELLRTKFTNDGLYGWMEGQLRTVYFQCYQAAYEMAKGAQRTFQHQLGSEATYISYGAWDSSARGLLAGERLYLQLKQMERAYYDKQVRELEIAKDVSVAQLDPLALIALKETGVCEIEIPEWLFDIDYAGQYFRRLKTVSLSIPAVVGRPTSLSAILTLLSSKVRETSRIVGSYGAEENYRPDHLAVEAIAASTGLNDSGRFQLDLRDEKYLPFEGAGVMSRWRIELPRKFRSFDYDTISDVVFHLKYTARRDDTLASLALSALQATLDATASGPMFRLFSLRHDFPNEWQTLRASPTRAATLTIAKERFPLLVQGGALTVAQLHASLILKEPRPSLGFKATLTPGTAAPIDLAWPGAPGRYRSDAKTTALSVAVSGAETGWRLQVTAPTLAADMDTVRDILIAVRYSVKM